MSCRSRAHIRPIRVLPTRTARRPAADAMRIETSVPQEFDTEHDSFRGELASVHKDGRRKWVYARQPSGRFYTARTLVGYVLLALLFLGPFVRLHGQPILLLNVLDRKFIVFGLVFWP